MKNQRTLNQMPEFQQGLRCFDELQQSTWSTDERLAFTLGVLARLYQEVDDKDALWSARQKIWQVEEKLGEMCRKKLELEGYNESSKDR
ncbi:hypothetical protein [Pseudobacteriovorax antillogorgiicola]|uniref:Uncharacterized protein n=1 Tax=Pseudobacteriovorax antillogorgiicola TaxID=1513793 RepID=A0A1Y6C950_9BACT|nr:hypothetical protein [Pseudobacteriovorax antillogorgiicola]TCS51668.1 hypothetical protein EDD56_11053 [Pseudobacteriovorax antillogorgiicola]SMF48959.1 hypothetical protein SAMN06296036_11522 [Pseudobacteriovorax antillogorgiicola]